MLFFQSSRIFLAHVLSANGISANPEKVDKAKNWLVLKNAKNCIHSWDWHYITAYLFHTLHALPYAYINLSVQQMSNRTGVKCKKWLD